MSEKKWEVGKWECEESGKIWVEAHMREGVYIHAYCKDRTKDEVWRVAYNNHERGTVMNFNGEPVRVLDFKVPEDRKYYEDWESGDQMRHCGPDEKIVRGYWTHEGYHQSYCRKRRR